MNWEPEVNHTAPVVGSITQNVVPIVGAGIFPEQKSSVEISRNSKGEAQYSIKVYDADPQVALTKALELRTQIEEKLKKG
jgi:hypothetical protein